MDAAKVATAAGTASPLRQLEMEAYSAIVNAFFAQGELTWRKEQLLQEARAALKVSDAAHRRELARVHADNSLLQLRSTSLQDSYFPKIYDEPKQVAPERITGKRRRAAYPVPAAAAGEALQITKTVAAASDAPPPPVKKQRVEVAESPPLSKVKPKPKPKAPAKPKAAPAKPKAAPKPKAETVAAPPAAAPAAANGAAAASAAPAAAPVANGETTPAAGAQGPSDEELAVLKAQIEAIKEKKMAIARQLSAISEAVALPTPDESEDDDEDDDETDGDDEEDDEDEEMTMATSDEEDAG